MLKNMALLIICIMTLSGCKTTVLGLVKDPAFTFEKVNSSQFIVGGVVSVVQDMSDLESNTLSNSMVRTFQEEMNSMHFQSSGQVIQTLGAPAYLTLLQKYQAFGTLELKALQIIHHKNPALHYIVFCRIENNHVSQKRTEKRTDVADTTALEKQKIYSGTRVDISYTTTRNMGASLIIYDLALQRSVWTGFINQSTKRSNDSSQTYPKPEKKSARLKAQDILLGLPIAVAKIAMGIEDTPLTYPEAPTTLVVFERVIAAFAENMPEEEHWYTW